MPRQQFAGASPGELIDPSESSRAVLVAYRLHFHSVTFGRKNYFMELREIMTCDVEVVSGLPILSSDKRLVGIVSLGDIAVHVGDREMAGETLNEVSQPTPKR